MFLLTALIAINSLFAVVTANLPFELRRVDKSVFKIDGINYRLPNNTHPETYDISLITRVDIDDFDFTGFVRIGIVVDHPTREIVLHARKIVITNIKLFRHSRKGFEDIELLPFKYDNVPEFLTIPTNGIDLNAGDRLKLEIYYSGELRTDNGGFYRSVYRDSDGNLIWLATTQFAPTDARHAFPCFDEPALKAKFKIKITHGSRYNAISNMPETRIENDNETATTTFADTHPLSTYLIAFVVSDFKFTTNTNDSNLFRYRVYSQPSQIENTKLALKNGERLLNALGDYLKVNYTWPKMDQVAVPSLNYGAMENWGLVIYQEQGLLWNRSAHPYGRKISVVKLISHEFSHQWFGNLVSPKWWNYIWLNEGFATLFEYIGTDLVFPEWNVINTFVIRTVHSTLTYDSELSTRAMSHYVESPEAIHSLFDNVAYAKSGSVLRMFLHAFTEGSFKKGLKHYLTKHAYKSVDEDDLFASLDKAAKEDNTLAWNLNVRDIFSSWSNQKGYPLLTVQRNYNTNTVTLSQKRFLNKQIELTENPSWWIPYNYATLTNPNFNDTSPDGWLPQNVKSKVIYGKWSPNDWIVFNKQQTGLYRILYDETNYKLISKQLNGENFTAIHVLSRSQMIDDLFEFLLVDLVKPNTLYEMLSYLQHETEYEPWTPALKVIRKLKYVLSGSKYNKNFRSYVATLSKKFFESTGVEEKPDDNYSRKHSRLLATNLACEFGEQSCLNATYAKLKELLYDDSGSLNLTLLSGDTYYIYTNGMKSTTAEDVKFIWNRLTTVDLMKEGYKILSLFQYLEDNEIASEYLAKSIVDVPANSSYLRRSLFHTLCSSNPYIAIDFIQKHALKVKECFNDLDDTMTFIAYRILSVSHRKQLKNLLINLRNQDLISDGTVSYANQILDDNFVEINRHQEAYEAWFAGSEKSSSATIMYTSITLVLCTIFYSILFNF